MKYWSLIYLVLVGFNLFIWQGILVSGEEDVFQIHFLDIGQGDSQLVILPGGVRMLIDGGSNKGVLFELEEVIPATERYIDLVLMSHPQLDHYGGLKDVIDRYEVGAFIFSGREGDGDAWLEFKEKLVDREVNIITLLKGDEIVYGESLISILLPDQELLKSRDANESSLVLKIESQGVKALLTGDISAVTDKYITEQSDVDIDILKVAHHGSRYSTGSLFLNEATPAISVIQVGENRFGHPTQSVLQRLWGVGSSVYRNDQDGRISIISKEGVLGVTIENKLD